MHILINALSMGSGGGFTVGRELLHHLAALRPDWKITFAIIGEHALHQQVKQSELAGNIALLEAPPSTLPRQARARWEKQELTRWAEHNGVAKVLQLNGMLVPGMKPPTLCHMQDPWPYRAEAWSGWKDRVIALLKRRQHRYSLQHAAAFGWTSDYLRQLICGEQNIWPKWSEVLYNGVADEWIARAGGELLPLEQRPMEIVTVSNVNFYKRQELVIRALPQLIRKPGLESLIYRIVGAVDSAELQNRLQSLAAALGVGERVVFEGRVSAERVTEVFTHARAYVLMSVCESFGIPALEAMSFGTPVVTANCCAMPEVCGDAAEFVTPDDVDATVKAITRVLIDLNHAGELRRQGIERVGRFTWASAAEKLALMLESMAIHSACPGKQFCSHDVHAFQGKPYKGSAVWTLNCCADGDFNLHHRSVAWSDSAAAWMAALSLAWSLAESLLCASPLIGWHGCAAWLPRASLYESVASSPVAADASLAAGTANPLAER